MRRSRSAFLGFSLVTLVACASGTGGAAGGSATGDVVTARDLAGTTWTTAYEVLQNNHHLRVTDEGVFLRNRGPLSINAANQDLSMLLVLDGTQIHNGVPDVLRSIEVHQIRSIRILTGGEAGSRFGSEGGSGVLIIQTQRGS
jgi:hypothetical protein